MVDMSICCATSNQEMKKTYQVLFSFNDARNVFDTVTTTATKRNVMCDEQKQLTANLPAISGNYRNTAITIRITKRNNNHDTTTYDGAHFGNNSRHKLREKAYKEIDEYKKKTRGTRVIGDVDTRRRLEHLRAIAHLHRTIVVVCHSSLNHQQQQQQFVHTARRTIRRST
jgi:hypothetical protein